jgi:uncharacterized iron-regulated membrane protein
MNFTSRLRPIFTRLHRWAGLTTAGFLLIAGLTGSLLAFEHELEALLNPHLFLVTRTAGAPPPAALDPFELRERAQRLVPQADVNEIVFRPQPGQSAMFWLTPRTDPDTGKPFELAADQLFVDPATGAELGRRQWGALISSGRIHPENLVPFLWRVHSSLVLPDPWGIWLFGAIAIVWTLDCFIGFYLTLPRLQRAQRPFLMRWKPAWLIKWHSGAYRINLDLHRSLGLWLWAMLLIYAWSSVMLNLRQEVYTPVMSLAFEFSKADDPARAKTAPETCARLVRRPCRRPTRNEPPGSRARLHDQLRGQPLAESQAQYLHLPGAHERGCLRCRARRRQDEGLHRRYNRSVSWRVLSQRRGGWRYGEQLASGAAHGTCVGIAVPHFRVRSRLDRCRTFHHRHRRLGKKAAWSGASD